MLGNTRFARVFKKLFKLSCQCETVIIFANMFATIGTESIPKIRVMIQREQMLS